MALPMAFNCWSKKTIHDSNPCDASTGESLPHSGGSTQPDMQKTGGWATTASCVSTRNAIEAEESPELGHDSGPPPLVLASRADRLKHGRAMLEDIAGPCGTCLYPRPWRDPLAQTSIGMGFRGGRGYRSWHRCLLRCGGRGNWSWHGGFCGRGRRALCGFRLLLIYGRTGA